MSTEFFGRFPVVFEKIGDVFGMFRQNSAILCAPLRASETPHFRALSRLMRVALCAANDFPRTVFNLQSNVARAFQIGPHRPVNELESVCSKKNDKIVKIVIENLA